jgi:hypothetical protein
MMLKAVSVIGPENLNSPSSKTEEMLGYAESDEPRK